jgi:fused signal recognition particle receptor
MWGRKKLASQLADLLRGSRSDATFFDELEDILIEGDVGAGTAVEIVDILRASPSGRSREELFAEIKGILGEHVRTAPLAPETGRLNVFLIMGVNGVGKTTTIAKLAQHFRAKTGKILLAAADTYRAAAIEQLAAHGERLGLPVVSQSPGADPGAVIFDSLARAQARGMDVVIADTAGRMHTKTDLIRELSKIDKVIRTKIGGEPYFKILVVDATTGQNALAQAETFHEAVGVDSLILAKYDSTAKGGIVVPIGRKLGLPFSFMGVGERREDLVVFDKEKYLRDLLGLDAED